MIELAQNHKTGLPIRNPVLVAGGIVGYGDSLPNGFDAAAVGGIVIGPFARSGYGGSPPPRYAPAVGGMILGTGGQRRSAQSVMRQFSHVWKKLDCAVIAQVVETSVHEIESVVSAIDRVQDINGIELASNVHDLSHMLALVKRVLRKTSVPVLVKIPLFCAPMWAEALCEHEVAGIVVGQPLPAAVIQHSDRDNIGANASTAIVRGDYFGPASFPFMLAQLLTVMRLDLPCSIVAAGGIHTLTDATQTLEAGATAIQLDTAIWIEPGIATWIAETLADGVALKRD